MTRPDADAVARVVPARIRPLTLSLMRMVASANDPRRKAKD